MNKIRFSFLVAVAALLLTAGGLRSQTSIQSLTFSLLGEYQTNTFYTNTAVPPLTNETLQTRDILITTANVVRALAYDLEGTNWLVWNGAALLREVNLTNGNEGIFLRKGTNDTNVSSFFGGSFSNNFTAGLTNAFPGVTDNLTNAFNPESGLEHGTIRMTDATNTVTNIVTTAGLYFISFNTTNIKFNLVGVGDGAITNVVGRIHDVLYKYPVNSQYLGTAGAFELNTTTNYLDTGTNNLPVYETGPLHGTISTTAPGFSEIQGP